jgi:hypothetical protein
MIHTFWGDCFLFVYLLKQGLTRLVSRLVWNSKSSSLNLLTAQIIGSWKQVMEQNLKKQQENVCVCHILNVGFIIHVEMTHMTKISTMDKIEEM